MESTTTQQEEETPPALVLRTSIGTAILTLTAIILTGIFTLGFMLGAIVVKAQTRGTSCAKQEALTPAALATLLPPSMNRQEAEAAIISIVTQEMIRQEMDRTLRRGKRRKTKPTSTPAPPLHMKGN